MSEQKDVRTKGNVLVNKIEIGDIHYEFEYGHGLKCEVITKPTRDENGYWSWQSKDLKTGGTINYGVSEGHSHYAPNLYDYEAYGGVTY